MNKRQIKVVLQCFALLALTAAVANAQGQLGTNAAPGIEAALKWVARMLLGAFGWISLIMLIWHCIEWTADRGGGQHLASMGRWAIFSGLGFAAYFVVSQLQTAAIAPF